MIVWLVMLINGPSYASDPCKDFSNRGLEMVPAPSISCRNTRKLNLSRNSIPEIHAGNFDGYHQLSILDLSYNEIAEIGPGAFRGLYALSDLTLSHNPLKQLRRSSFFNLSAKFISCKGSSLEWIESEIFSRDLLYLNLADNRLSYLPKKTLHKLVNIHSIDISNNELEKVHSETFQTNKVIREIHLNDNNLPMLPEDIFYGLEELENVDISNNPLLNAFSLRVTSPNLTITICSNSCDLDHLPNVTLTTEKGSVQTYFQGHDKVGETFDTVDMKVLNGEPEIVGTKGATEKSLKQSSSQTQPDVTFLPTNSSPKRDDSRNFPWIVIVLIAFLVSVVGNVVQLYYRWKARHR